jgi:hypothetical protein
MISIQSIVSQISCLLSTSTVVATLPRAALSIGCLIFPLGSILALLHAKQGSYALWVSSIENIDKQEMKCGSNPTTGADGIKRIRSPAHGSM